MNANGKQERKFEFFIRIRYADFDVGIHTVLLSIGPQINIKNY